MAIRWHRPSITRGLIQSESFKSPDFDVAAAGTDSSKLVADKRSFRDRSSLLPLLRVRGGERFTVQSVGRALASRSEVRTALARKPFTRPQQQPEAPPTAATKAFIYWPSTQKERSAILFRATHETLRGSHEYFKGISTLESDGARSEEPGRYFASGYPEQVQ